MYNLPKQIIHKNYKLVGIFNDKISQDQVLNRPFFIKVMCF